MLEILRRAVGVWGVWEGGFLSRFGDDFQIEKFVLTIREVVCAVLIFYRYATPRSNCASMSP